METAEILKVIAELRAMGARRCVVSGVEVDFAPVPTPVTEAAPRVKPEEAARIAREQDDKVLYAASG